MTWQIAINASALGVAMLNPMFSTVEHSGAVIVSDFIDGYLVTRRYYDYNITQALKKFREEFGYEEMKPTREQFDAVEAVAVALSALTDLWDDNLDTIYHQLEEETTRDLLTVSLDEMASAWGGFRYALGDLTKTANQ
jgi:hypothetical protein